MSKELFFKMRAEDMARYEPNFTKKQAQATGIKLITDALERGEVTPIELATNIIRLTEVLNSALATIKNKLPFEKQNFLGMEFTPVNGGKILSYDEDPIYADIKKELKEREELLKVAFKSDKEIYDEAGVEVTKVGYTERKSSITVKY
jgi:hypothetical protein